MDTERPDFIVSGGRFQLNAAGRAFEQMRAQVERDAALVAQSWAGAFLSSLFVEMPWLDAFELSITASHEYDDEGGTFLSYTSSCSAVQIVEDGRLPDSVVSDDGVFDAELAADRLAEQFDAIERDLFVSLSDDPSGEVTIRVTRKAIAPFIAAGSVSGIAAFRALFPDRASPTVPESST